MGRSLYENKNRRKWSILHGYAYWLICWGMTGAMRAAGMGKDHKKKPDYFDSAIACV
jgi:hypothetical protein